MKKLSFKGILIGGIVDVGLSLVLDIPFVIYVLVKVAALHLSKTQLHDAIYGMNRELPIFLGQLIVGVACSALGGYLAARIAKRNEVLNGAMSSWFCLLIAGIAFFRRVYTFSAGVSILMTLAGPAGSAFGGYLRLMQNRKMQTVG